MISAGFLECREAKFRVMGNENILFQRGAIVAYMNNGL